MNKDGIRPIFTVGYDEEIGIDNGNRNEEGSEASEESEPGEEDIEIGDEEEEVLEMYFITQGQVGIGYHMYQ